MDRKLKRCGKSRRCSVSVDRLSSLPDELLGRILCLLPTKDVAATQVLCKRMLPALSWISTVDLDDCVHLVDRFPVFESFIDTLSPKLCGLTKFRLRLGTDIFSKCHYHRPILGKFNFPYVKPDRLYKWISYPLTKHGLRELDLSFCVDNPSECKLPPQLFDFQSLEVLKLCSNLEIDSGVELFPLIRLPNLKILHLRYIVFTEDHFITRLVSTCPVLEELKIDACHWTKCVSVTISSHSIRRLLLIIFPDEEENNRDLVHIDTPNLQYFKYVDNLSHRYSIPHLNALVEAHIDLMFLLRSDSFETSIRVMRGLLNPLSDVTRLSLQGCVAEGLYGSPSNLECKEGTRLEGEGWRRAETIPSCLLTHLKRIELRRCFGDERELTMITFLLSKALVLKEFVICLTTDTRDEDEDEDDVPHLDQFRSTLDDLPTLSDSCSIIYTDS